MEQADVAQRVVLGLLLARHPKMLGLGRPGRIVDPRLWNATQAALAYRRKRVSAKTHPFE
jgi:hypothetical protein